MWQKKTPIHKTLGDEITESCLFCIDGYCSRLDEFTPPNFLGEPTAVNGALRSLSLTWNLKSDGFQQESLLPGVPFFQVNHVTMLGRVIMVRNHPTCSSQHSANGQPLINFCVLLHILLGKL